MSKGKAKRSDLLSAQALTDIRLGISVSETPDLLRLGLLETHFRLALGEIARCVLVSGGHLAYGGHLRPDGYTSFLVGELERYSRRDRPLRVCLAWSEHRKLALSVLEKEKRDLGLYGEIVCLDSAGSVVAPNAQRDEVPPPPLDAEATRQSLTGLRQYMARNTHGRVLIGGKRAGFHGNMPGLLEEVLYAVEQSQPVYLAGGFGGITHDVATALGVDDGSWFPKRDDEPPPDERLAGGIAKLVEAAKATKLQSLENGLTAAENRRLAACHRPSEIATLVSLGLGRRFVPRKGSR